MFAWLARKRRERRAAVHLAVHPEDTAVVELILTITANLPVSSARDLAQMAAGRLLSDAEWTPMAERWERPWSAIV